MTANESPNDPADRRELREKTVPTFPKLPRWLSTVYFFVAVMMYIAVELRWWPIFLYALIWPCSDIWERGIGPVVFSWIVGSPETASPQSYVAYNLVSGAYYIVGGTLWVWIVGKFLSGFVFRTTVADEHDNEKSSA